METTLHKSETRGIANHGWLKSHHTFSFASYFDSERMGFGTLRVINDDVVAPSMGFGTHPHQNMEIISIPLKGSLKHQDTMGNNFVIKRGEVQAMSAGTGIAHSEYNNSREEDVNFLQIWVLPKHQDIQPEYSQENFPEENREGKFQLVISPDGRDRSVRINQDAYFSMTKLNSRKSLTYKKYQGSNGVYFFVIDGSLKINGQELSSRDGMGIVGKDDIDIESIENSEVLIMEVPME